LELKYTNTTVLAHLSSASVNLKSKGAVAMIALYLQQITASGSSKNNKMLTQNNAHWLDNSTAPRSNKHFLYNQL